MAIFAEQEGLSTDAGGTHEATLGLRQYLDVVRRRKWIVLSIFAVAVAAALAVSLAMDPLYQAKTKIVVGQGNSLFQPGEANAVQPFTATMGDLVHSNVVAQTVLQELGLKTTPEQLLKKMDVSINPETAVVKVTVRDHSKSRAVEIADHIGTVFSRLVRMRFGTQALPGPGGTTQLPLTATVFDPAHADPDPVSPRPLRNTVLAGILGLILGLLAAFLREHFDRDLRTRDAVERSFGVPVIGQIPTLGGSERKGVLAQHRFGPVDEAFRALRANLQYLAVRRPLRTILVTSAGPRQGKTTVTANLAVVLAQSGASAIAIEGDLRRPRLNELFDARGSASGLTGVLVGAEEPDEVVVDVPHGSGDSARLSFLPSGPLPPNPSELLSSGQMARLLERLGVLYDHVLIDSPPILLVADALELARLVDGVVLVVRRNETTTDEARDVRALVDRLGINLVGVVFTDVKPAAGYGYSPYAPVSEAGRKRRRRGEPARGEPEPQPERVRSGL